MGMIFDDAVIVEHGKNSGDPTVVTVNCPDKAGLGCDLCRIVLEFGLHITRGDLSTDGKWCYVVLFVAARPSSSTVDWESLKTRLLSVCPSPMSNFYFIQQSASSTPVVYLLKIVAVDTTGLLHDVTKVLCELELSIQRVKVMTTPDGKIVDLFFITDEMDLLHTKDRRERTCEHLRLTLDEYCIICEIQPAGPEYDQRGISSISPPVAEELFSCETSSATPTPSKKVKNSIVTVDNLLSPAHTLLQIRCRDQKGIFYDILRTSKDCEIQVAHGRMSSSVECYRNMDLLIRTTDGRKILDQDYLVSFCSRLEEEMIRPLRVTITSRGPDTELLVANPVELSGKGRPRVFYDVTFALKTLRICIFAAEVLRHSTSDRQWEVYRFRLNDSKDFPLASSRARTAIIDKVKTTLMGW
ncbi:hypothetical protein Leryth_002592 [Lithospermum erythrorhizon]|uniref:ACT domain-containing protein ACR n=1 Tax=Lithospermum erythrorhizon TaxID=34254 RepID=A0AAV3Q7P2_LITER|nr:hypothetical protein Leryth_002592 [Lithospermum erythrorhizon]